MAGKCSTPAAVHFLLTHLSERQPHLGIARMSGSFPVAIGATTGVGKRTRGRGKGGVILGGYGIQRGSCQTILMMFFYTVGQSTAFRVG